jgi:hypothetical protein
VSAARRDIAAKGEKALKRAAGVGGRLGRASSPPVGTTMPDTLATFESNSIPSGHAVGPVNGHRANRQSSKAQRPRDAAVRSTGEGCEALELWRQFKHAEETLNARIDEDDDAPEIAYHEAQDRFIDCRVASLDGVLLKLLLINEMEDLDRDLKDAPRWALPRIIKSLLQDLEAQVGSGDIALKAARQCEKDKASAQPAKPLIAPTVFIERVIGAVLPLIGPEGDDFAPGKTWDDVVAALLLICGHFTVTDGVFASLLLKAADHFMSRDDNLPEGQDNPRSTAKYFAWQSLTDFACHAWATGPTCVEARIHLMRFGGLVGGDLGDRNERAIRRMIALDASHLRRRDFRGATFGRVFEGQTLPHWWTSADTFDQPDT